MTLKELFEFLTENSSYEFITAESPIIDALNGKHENELMGEIISSIATGCACDSVDCELKREEVIKAIGPLRLKYMKDDAPVEGFRLIEGSVPVIDLAFNSEALKNRS